VFVRDRPINLTAGRFRMLHDPCQWWVMGGPGVAQGWPRGGPGAAKWQEWQGWSGVE
jgi:hypothetical protein